jgi:hypothetical protein
MGAADCAGRVLAAPGRASGLTYLWPKGVMGLGYIIFNPSGSLESLFGRARSRNEGMSVLTNRIIDSGIRSICHMVVSRVLMLAKARTRA